MAPERLADATECALDRALDRGVETAAPDIGSAPPSGDARDSSKGWPTTRPATMGTRTSLRVSSLRVSTHQTDTRGRAHAAPTFRSEFPLSQVPSARELRALGASALASVPSFLVGREGFGASDRDGPVDLSAVRAEGQGHRPDHARRVTVYDGRASATKPPRGSGLNRPATVTLLGVFPEAIERLEAYAKDGSTVVSYDPAAGAWTFRVRHFSRYGMDLDASDSEEEEEDVMEIPEERAARKIAATRAEDAPFATTRGGPGDASASSFSSRGPPGPRRLRKPRAPRTRSARRARRRRFRANPRTQRDRARFRRRAHRGGRVRRRAARARDCARRATARRGARRRRAPAAAAASHAGSSSARRRVRLII